MLICIHVICGHFCLVATELHSCDKRQDAAQSLKYYCLALSRKSLRTSAPNRPLGEFMDAGIHISQSPW